MTERPDLSTCQALIFDLDGTLFESMNLWHEVDLNYLKGKGLSCPPDLQNELEGLSFHENAVYFRKRFKIRDSLEKIKEDWINMVTEAYCHRVPLKKGAAEFLAFIKKTGKKTAIASSNQEELILKALKSRELDRFIDVIATCDEAGANKPEPAVYLLAARKLGVVPCHCLAFEDIPKGICAGKAAGMKVCAVDDAYSAHLADEKRNQADYFIHDFTELLP